MQRLLALVVTVAALSLHARAQDAKPADPIPADDRLNAILWTMTSAEFEAASFMAFATAKAQLDAALLDKSRSAAPEQRGDYTNLPPAIIMDIDETILDNGPYQVRLMYNTTERPADLMSRWVEEANAKPLPGAVDFIANVQSKGVTIFYITNRNAEKEEATRKNLVAVGATFPKEFDTVFLERERPEWTGDKSTRRAAVAATHRVLLMLGDDLNDFVSAQRVPDHERRAIAEREAPRWGRDWIMIPNPMYGSWEGAAVDLKFRATPEERRRIKHDKLRVYR
jgi:acid phosphatase